MNAVVQLLSMVPVESMDSVESNSAPVRDMT